jgi:ribosomal protein L34E
LFRGKKKQPAAEVKQQTKALNAGEKDYVELLMVSEQLKSKQSQASTWQRMDLLERFKQQEQQLIEAERMFSFSLNRPNVLSVAEALIALKSPADKAKEQAVDLIASLGRDQTADDQVEASEMNDKQTVDKQVAMTDSNPVITKEMAEAAKKRLEEKAKMKKEKRKNQHVSNRVHYFSIDPGRSNVITVIEFSVDGKGRMRVLRKFRLTKRQYYTITGAFKYKYQMKSIGQMNEVKYANLFTKLYSLNVNLPTDLMEERFKVKNQLLENYATVEHLELDKQRQRKKQRAIDKYVYRQFTTSHDGLRIKQENVVIFYGGARFASSGKFERYGGSPTTSILKVVQRLFTTVLVDEYHTSKKCSICENDLELIKRNRSETQDDADESKKIYIRDYLNCKSCNCQVDRDYNACVNIAKASIGWHYENGVKVVGRPDYLMDKSIHKESPIVL